MYEHKRKSYIFQEVIFNTYELFYWNYDADFQLIDTNSTFPDVIGGVGFSGHLRKHLDSGKRTPIILRDQSSIRRLSCGISV